MRYSELLERKRSYQKQYDDLIVDLNYEEARQFAIKICNIDKFMKRINKRENRNG